MNTKNQFEFSPTDLGMWGQTTRTSEGNDVVDCGHSYCFGRSRWGGPLSIRGTGLPNGRTEFSIGRWVALQLAGLCEK